jgi:hypothetical protein
LLERERGKRRRGDGERKEGEIEASQPRAVTQIYSAVRQHPSFFIDQ